MSDQQKAPEQKAEDVKLTKSGLKPGFRVSPEELAAYKAKARKQAKASPKPQGQK